MATFPGSSLDKEERTWFTGSMTYRNHTHTAAEATCWCESAVVAIPAEWVGERTASCGRPECQDPAHPVHQLVKETNIMTDYTRTTDTVATSKHYTSTSAVVRYFPLATVTDENGVTTRVATCWCGCNEPSNGKSAFRQGHDARFKGILARCAASHKALVLVDPVSGEERDYDALDRAGKVPTGDWSSIVAASVSKMQEKRASKPKAEKPGLVGMVLEIKVGRWPYQAQVVSVAGDDAVLQYTKKDGTAVTLTRPVADLAQAV